MMNIRPCYGFHKWTQWVFFRKVSVFDDFSEDLPFEYRLVYVRKCEKCGVPKTKLVTVA